VDVHCERCGTSYALDETRLGEGGARVRCARCGHVFLVPKSAGTPPPAAAVTPSPTPAGETAKREWRVRRRDGSISALRELTTLQRWIVEGKLVREDEVGLSGENWRPLGSIADLETFFLAADARARVAALEEEVARLKLGVAPAPEVRLVAPPSEASASAPARPRAPTLTVPAAAVSAPVPAPVAPSVVPVPLTPEEPAFTRTKAGLGLVPTDDWEPPKLHRGVGARVAVLLLVLVVAGGLVAAYFYLWKPEMLRAREEQARNSQLEREQADHEASLRAAEQRAKDELLKSLAVAAAQDAGAALAKDGGPGPRGSQEVPATDATLAQTAEVPDAPATPAPFPTPAASLTGQAGGPSGEADSPAAVPKAAPSAQGAPQTFEEWMAEADRRRTHERAAAALAAYDKALTLKPQRSDAHAGRGLALLDLGRRPDALSEFQRALELDPRDGVAVLGLAEAYRSLGRSEEARRAYQRYLNGWPTGAEARAARAALESLKE
jgi:predicted Zn finger-like uncharacterized protein